MSERDLTADILALIVEGVVKPLTFLYADFPSGAYRVWTGVGNVTFKGETWVGTGGILALESVGETTDTAAQGIACKLDGVDAALYAKLVADEYQGHEVEIWLAFRHTTTGVIYGMDDPIWRGVLDSDEYTDDGENPSLVLRAEHRMADIIRRREVRYTHADQQLLYPGEGDTGLNKIEAIQEMAIPWGRTAK